jgi:hypothetical protein
MDCLVASLLAMTVNSKHTFAPRDAMRPSRAQIFRPMRAWGMPGAHCTRGLVCTLYW